jgi:uncharacterized protein (TIGR02452 family)
MSREIRINIAKDTLSVLKQGFYVNSIGEKIVLNEEQQFAESYSRVFSPIETDKLISEKYLISEVNVTLFKVINDTTLNAVRRLIDQGQKNVLCLNFASAMNPGGGFQNGSSAQEESIARATGLYPCLLKCDDYYSSNQNIKSSFYTDYIIYSPCVPIIKDETGEYLNKLKMVSVITAPAVNANVVRQREPVRIKEIEKVMKRRIEKVLRISIEHNHRHLVLGAWGCGVFGNSPVDISRYFKEIIDNEFSGAFKKIIFAIYSKDKNFIKPFYDNFMK